MVRSAPEADDDARGTVRRRGRGVARPGGRDRPGAGDVSAAGEPWTQNGGFHVIRRAAGRTSDVHPSAQRRFGSFLAGVIEVRAGDGGLFLSGDTTGKGHTAATLGDADAASLCLRVDAAAGGR